MKYRSVFLSDLHLGTRWSRVEPLQTFLGRVQCDFLYLVGDVIDGWKVSRPSQLSASHMDVLRRLWTLAGETKVTFLPGNHDAFMDRFLGGSLGKILLRDRALHRTADGRRFLVSHGDEFDLVVHRSGALNALAERSYDMALWVNAGINALLPLAGLRKRSLAGYLKKKFKAIAGAFSGFEGRIIGEVKKSGLDGVICGHLHNPVIRDIRDVLFCNCGDWVENCSALVEHFDGRLEMLRLNDAGDMVTRNS
ncbi:MAG: UDP-2,3-diacylglucosamine diphosphatase [Thermovirgaceae bacterium]|nr:UDP-2,3-diacylglucosamine diphosphatase [Thermovirgaceae bacterium]